MKDTNCAYCMREENPALYQKFGYPVCEMASGFLYLFREQSHPGRMILAYKDHADDIAEISAEERKVFFDDAAEIARIMHKLYAPKKINFGMYGDTGHHLHIHIVPKYEGEFEYGGTFAMGPGKFYQTDEKLEEMAAAVRKELGK